MDQFHNLNWVWLFTTYCLFSKSFSKQKILALPSNKWFEKSAFFILSENVWMVVWVGGWNMPESEDKGCQRRLVVDAVWHANEVRRSWGADGAQLPSAAPSQRKSSHSLTKTRIQTYALLQKRKNSRKIRQCNLGTESSNYLYFMYIQDRFKIRYVQVLIWLGDWLTLNCRECWEVTFS